MEVSDFIAKLKTCGFDAFENEAILKIIKGCDNGTRQVFFSDAPTVSGVQEGWKEVAIKLIAYVISVSPNAMFINSISNKTYESVVGNLLKGNCSLWQDILEMLVSSICLDERPDTAFWDAFFSCVKTEQFIVGADAQSDAYPQFPRLCFELVKKYLPEKFDEFCTEWKKYVSEERYSCYTQTVYLEGYISSGKLMSGIKDSVHKALTEQTNYSSTTFLQRRNYVIPPGKPREIYNIYEKRDVTTETYDTGLAVRDWLLSAAVQKYLGEVEEPNVHTDSISYGPWMRDTYPPSGGCVTGSTQILLADGSSKNIAGIGEGERIRNGEGGISETSDEKIKNMQIQYLYGINGREPFMSPEHAVMTREGWKSLEPEISNAINPNYHVKLLQKGDYIVTLDGEEEVRDITRMFAPEGEMFTGYDLHFRTGSASYYANGLLVLLNYPEITLASVFKNLEKMEAQDAERFEQLFMENMYLFEQVFGSAAVRQFKQKMEEDK